MSAVQKFPPAHLIPDESEENEAGKKPEPQRQHAEHEEQPQLLGLPAPPREQKETKAGEGKRLDLGAGGDASAVKFDHLGPMVINSDGTLSRIHNWEAMTDGERERTLMVLGKRNKARLATLEAARG